MGLRPGVIPVNAGEHNNGRSGRSSSPWVQQFMNGLPDGPVPFHFQAPDYREDLLRDS